MHSLFKKRIKKRRSITGTGKILDRVVAQAEEDVTSSSFVTRSLLRTVSVVNELGHREEFRRMVATATITESEPDMKRNVLVDNRITYEQFFDICMSKEIGDLNEAEIERGKSTIVSPHCLSMSFLVALPFRGSIQPNLYLTAVLAILLSRLS